VASPATTIDALPNPPTRNGYSFAGWNTQAGGGGSAFTNTTTVNSDTTVYAQWIEFSISLKPDAGTGALSQTDFTLSGNETIDLSFTGEGYTDPRWFVDGDLKGTGPDITIIAAEYGLGTHTLTLMVTKSGVSWSQEITFIVE
jgi:uncharacterized repeat protein (TIGR02543 family)